MLLLKLVSIRSENIDKMQTEFPRNGIFPRSGMHKREQPGVVACTCNLATLKAKYQNRFGLPPHGGKSSSIDEWTV